MAIKFEISMTNKWLYSLIVVGVILAFGVGILAYQSDMRVGNPAIVGHSAGEINVENSAGEIVSLQDALDGLTTGSYWVPSDIKTTSTTHNGNFGGYKQLQDWIQTNGCSGYHVCDSHEITRYVMQTGSNLFNGWVIEATSRDWHRQGAKYNDCGGWQSTANGDYGVWGTIWSSTNNRLEKIICSGAKSVLCCK